LLRYPLEIGVTNEGVPQQVRQETSEQVRGGDLLMVGVLYTKGGAATGAAGASFSNFVFHIESINERVWGFWVMFCEDTDHGED